MRPGTSDFSRTTTAKKRGLNSFRKKQDSPLQTEQVRTQPAEIGQIYDLIESTIIQQKECQSMGKYVQAQGFKRKVKFLKQQLQVQEINSLKARQEKELQQLQQFHHGEINLFHQQNSKSISQFQKEMERMMNELSLKHQKQLDEVKESGDIKFRESPKLMELRNVQQELARQENYLEAHRIQLKVSQLEKEEIEKYQKINSNKSKFNLTQLKVRQEAQLQALQQKIQTQLEEKERQRKNEEGKLIQKYDNILKQTQFQHNQELIKLNKAAKLNQLHHKSKAGLFSYSKS